MADWKSFVIQVPGKDLLEPARNVLEQLMVFLEVLKTILNTIKAFLIDFGNPLKALVEALISLIEELFLSLKVSGVSALFHVPNPVEDPNFDNHRGFDSFLEVFKQSLFDAQDFNRPQPRAGSSKGGFVLLLVSADAPFGLIGKIKQLLRFFNQEFTTPRYAAPQNLKAAPLGPDGDPLLRVADIFEFDSTSIGLTWDLPTSSETPDPGFNELISRVANEFVPANYLIEKSTINPSVETIDIADIKNGGKAGSVQLAVTKSVAGTSETIEEQTFLRDDNNERIIKFTEYIVLDSTAIASLIGQLGRMRWVDTDVLPDQEYYYRVRAFSGDLDVSSSGQINWGDLEYIDGRVEPQVRWPSTSSDPESVCVVGKASSIASVRLPDPPAGSSGTPFDVVGTLRTLFQASFTVEFHLNVTGTDDPIGRGSMTKLAGPVASFQSSDLASSLQSSAFGDTIETRVLALSTQIVLEFPWENRAVRKQSARLADAVASAMLQSGKETLVAYRDLLQVGNPLLSEANLEDALAALTSTDGSDGDKAALFVSAYNDDNFRSALLEAVSLIKSFTGGGVAPDWITISPLRDIVPWSGQLIYDLLDKIQALVDATAGVNAEISAFIDLLLQKINTLERTLEFLLNILNFIESLQMGAFVLAVPEVNGTATNWVQEVDSAGGEVPPSGPGGYSAGVALAYVAPDVTAFKTAFSVIFGA